MTIAVNAAAVRELHAINRGIDPSVLFDAVMKRQGGTMTWDTAEWLDQCVWLDAFASAEVSYVIH